MSARFSSSGTSSRPSLQNSGLGKSFRRRLVNDDEESGNVLSIDFWKRIASFIRESAFFFGSNIALLTGWSCLCAWAGESLATEASKHPGGSAERWLRWIDNTSTAITVVGVFFFFSLVFRFNTCYERWYEGRMLWGDLIHATLDLDEMNRCWIVDEKIGDRLSRWTVCIPFACKAQLRGHSLGEPTECGKDLVERGILTSEELQDMEDHPCWQPLYALDIIRAIIVKAYKTKGAFVFDSKDFIRCFDNGIIKISHLIGGTVRIRSAGLPKSYDFVHFAVLYSYYILAPMSWAPSLQWALPPLVFFSLVIILTLFFTGSALVDPFGTDLVDLPLENFCAVIEAQSREIRARSKRMKGLDFPRSSNTFLDDTSLSRLSTESCSLHSIEFD